MSKSDSRQRGESIFETLLQLPLLKGTSQARISEIAGRVKLNFSKAAAGSVIVEPGDQARSLLFVIRGSVRLTSASADGSFVVGQTLRGPQVIAPDTLFGLTTAYPCRVEALDADVGLMEISKEEYRKMLSTDQVFFFNYLNAVCAGSQRASRGLMAVTSGTPAERLAYWLTTLTQVGATDIEVSSTERDLHTLFGLTAAGMRTAVERLGPAVTAPDARTLRVSSREQLRGPLKG